MNRVDKTESYLSTLPQSHQNLMIKYREHLHRIRNCIDENFQIIRKLIEDVGSLFENTNQAMVPKTNRSEDDDIRLKFQDMDKVYYRFFRIFLYTFVVNEQITRIMCVFFQFRCK